MKGETGITPFQLRQLLMPQRTWLGVPFGHMDDVVTDGARQLSQTTSRQDENCSAHENISRWNPLSLATTMASSGMATISIALTNSRWSNVTTQWLWLHWDALHWSRSGTSYIILRLIGPNLPNLINGKVLTSLLWNTSSFCITIWLKPHQWPLLLTWFNYNLIMDK